MAIYRFDWKRIRRRISARFYARLRRLDVATAFKELATHYAEYNPWNSSNPFRSRSKIRAN